MRRFNVVLATAVVLGGMSAVPAFADTGSTVYVNPLPGSGCSDTDPAAGTAAVPYCTLQTAVDAAQPGQTVQIAPATYPPLRITHSGTAEQPIVLQGTEGPAKNVSDLNAAGTGDATALDIDGASYISVNRLGMMGGTDTVRVRASDHITLDESFISPAMHATGLDIDGSDHTTVARTSLTGGPVLVHDQAQDTRLLVDSVQESLSPDAAVVVDGADGTLLRNDTVDASQGGGVAVRGGAGGTRIDDSVLAESKGGPELSVAADSTAGTTERYDVLQPVSGGTPYQWGGTTYATQAAFAQATAQGTADCAGSCGVTPDSRGKLSEFSAAIDSEDPSVTGLPDTDFRGARRVADPLVDAKGGSTGEVDRGAYEFTDPLREELTFTPDLPGPLYSPAAGTLRATLDNPWNDPVTPDRYTFDFGDGTPEATGTDAEVTHTYPAGPWFPKVTMTSTAGNSYVAGTYLSPYNPFPLTTSIHVGVSPTTPLSATVQVQDSDTADWSITGRTVDWGDGSAPQDLGAATTATHTYPHAGGWTVTETSTDDHGRTAQATERVVTGSAFLVHAPTRLLDTRTTTGGHHGALSAGGTLSLQVTGIAGIPATGVTAVVVNLTSVSPSAHGYLTAYGAAGSRPTASSLNYAAGENRANLVTIPVGPDGKIRIYSSAHTDVVADLAGYYRTGAQVPGATLMNTSRPYRVLDTRNGSGTPVGAGQVVKVHLPSYVAGDCTALVLNITVVSPSVSGHITAYASGTAPNTSSVNFRAGHTTAGQAVVPVAADGTVSIRNSAGEVHLVVDVEGSYDPYAGQVFVPAGPTRLLDTRTSGGPMQNLQQITLDNGIPADAKAILLNVTETQAQGGGHLSAGAAPSTINFTTGQTSANGAVMDLEQGATITNHSQGVQAVVDLQGWFG